MGYVVRYHINHVISDLSIAELTLWANSHGTNIGYLIDLAGNGPVRLGHYVHWVCSALQLENATAREMFHRWPQAFPNGIHVDDKEFPVHITKGEN